MMYSSEAFKQAACFVDAMVAIEGYVDKEGLHLDMKSACKDPDDMFAILASAVSECMSKTVKDDPKSKAMFLVHFSELVLKSDNRKANGGVSYETPA